MVSAALAERICKPFIDADDLHPKINLAKMSAGISLDNDDRWPWLEWVGEALSECLRCEGMVICACSALRREYREYLEKLVDEPILFVYLNGSAELISQHIQASDELPPWHLCANAYFFEQATLPAHLVD